MYELLVKEERLGVEHVQTQVDRAFGRLALLEIPHRIQLDDSPGPLTVSSLPFSCSSRPFIGIS
jgi:hypothetical protein